MKIKEGYILDTIGGQQVAVSISYAEDRFSGMVKLNAAGAYLWELLTQGCEEAGLVQALTEKYHIDAETAVKDVKVFLAKLEEKGILEQ